LIHSATGPPAANSVPAARVYRGSARERWWFACAWRPPGRANATTTRDAFLWPDDRLARTGPAIEFDGTIKPLAEGDRVRGLRVLATLRRTPLGAPQ